MGPSTDVLPADHPFEIEPYDELPRGDDITL
jgi:hypothetical protein